MGGCPVRKKNILLTKNVLLNFENLENFIRQPMRDLRDIFSFKINDLKLSKKNFKIFDDFLKGTFFNRTFLENSGRKYSSRYKPCRII